ncbi:hypothetical protein BCR32DRAFT_287627 [Anaeromyces robustus]|uniref:Uncharacterized protein n=1 Tax=Anaeromyces robustus TaxID=1754192 RepID=A0A1Y1VS77_9FUNG|nr:hypothetical protein BCR32DRAFT_287627 [Anaeromyces robustus]|eukprot:ORX63624.1 hypothetical protein BCR32DRAFT_287627 [Anaeromyces robustus]
MAQFLDYTLDILHNNPIDSLKQGALLLNEASTLIYPKAIGLRLSDIRDDVRIGSLCQILLSNLNIKESERVSNQ